MAEGSSARGPLIVVAGPPAAGKGTQCKRIAAEFGATHLSIGDVLREHARLGTALGAQARPYMDRGEYVPDELAMELVKDRLSQPDTIRGGCLLDGFPRTTAQAHALKANFQVDRCILLQAPPHTSVARALGRRIDPVTGISYHTEYVPAPADVAPRLVQRESDKSEETVRGRLCKHEETAGEIASIFSACMEVVDATQSVQVVFNKISEILSGLFKKSLVEDDDDWGDEAMDVDAAGDEGPVISLEAAPNQDVRDDCECSIVISIQVPEHSGTRAPADICCVVDISGSMGTEATYETDGVVRSDRLSYLDIVKHAVKTVMHMLKDGDRLALVAFDDKAELASLLLPMTEAGRERAIAALENLRPRGQTNLWAGILAGMEALRIPSESSAAGTAKRQKTLLVLTDGQPNEVPPEGHLAALRTYKESHPEFNIQINTFGFGYSLDSELLLELAVEGHGTYAFIPDAVIVGTVFVNSVANVLSTVTQNATLHLTAQGGAQLSGPVLGFGEHEVTDASWGKVVDLGPLQYGQTRDIVVPMRVPGGSAPYLSAVLTYPCPGAGEKRAFVEVEGRQASVSAGSSTLCADVVHTGQLAIIEGAAGNCASAQAGIGSLADRINTPGPCSADERVAAIKADVEGRMAKSVDGDERFNRWGKHYLRALVRAHHLQLCTNFMDPGLQVYGGRLYRSIREEGDAVFVGLAAPRPAADETAIPCDICRGMIPFSQYAEHIEACANPRRRPAAGGGGAAPAPRPRARSPSPDMQTYYQGGGGG